MPGATTDGADWDSDTGSITRTDRPACAPRPPLLPACSAQLGIGGGASVAAGPVGRAAAARALASVGAGAVVYSYSSTRGAYAGVALEALLISSRDAVNQASEGLGCG